MIRWNMLFIFTENPHGLKKLPSCGKDGARGYPDGWGGFKITPPGVHVASCQGVWGTPGRPAHHATIARFIFIFPFMVLQYTVIISLPKPCIAFSVHPAWSMIHY